MTTPSGVSLGQSTGSAEAPQFKVAAEELRKLAAPTLPLSFLWEFLLDGRTPARAVSDAAMRALFPALHGAKPIIELGAGGDYYKHFVPDDQPYVTSNLAPGSDLELDMTNLKLDNHSVDALVSVFALEHVYNFNAVFAEQERVLKPGGRLLLIVPFLYYYHAAPDDFFRFSASALNKLLAPFDILVKQPLGNRWLLFSEFLHEKVVMGSRMGFFARLALRGVALPFLAAGLKSHDPRYAFGFAYLCEKKAQQCA